MTTNRNWRDFNHSHFKPHIIGGPRLQPNHNQQPPNVPDFEQIIDEQIELALPVLRLAIKNCRCKEDVVCRWCMLEFLD